MAVAVGMVVSTVTGDGFTFDFLGAALAPTAKEKMKAAVVKRIFDY